MDISLANKTDLEELLALQKLAYIQEAEFYNNFNITPLHDTQKDIEREFKEKDIFKAMLNDKIVGSVRALFKKDTLYIGKLIVHPDAQNKGLGRKLMLHIEDIYASAKRFELFTAYASLKNLHLYHSLGYKEFKRERLESNPDMIFLEKWA